MLQLKVLISKHITIDGLASSSIMFGEISTLNVQEEKEVFWIQCCHPSLPLGQIVANSNFLRLLYLAHEPGDNTVEGGVFVTKPFVSGAQDPEIFWRNINVTNLQTQTSTVTKKNKKQNSLCAI